MKLDLEYEVREYMGEYVIVPSGRDLWDDMALFSVNEIGLFFLDLLKEGMGREEMMERTLKEYEVDRETVQRDLDRFLKSLKRKGLLTERD
jgi:hypothetical protein